MFRSHCNKYVAPAICSIFVLASSAYGQGFPSRPIALVTPFPPGTAQDVAARALTTEAAKTLGQPIVWESRAGAGSRLGVNALRTTARPDGYLLTLAPNTLLVGVQIADPEFKFEPGKDYMPVAMVNDYPLALIANPSVPFRTVKGLVDFAKANPGKLNAVAGGATLDLFWGFLTHVTGIRLTPVPYKASSAALPDLLAGRVDITLQAVTAKGYVDEGKLVGIATTGKERWQPFANLPTIIESGVPVSLTTFQTIIAPAATPRDVLSKLNLAIRGAMKAPEVVALMEKGGFPVTAQLSYGPDELLKLYRTEIELWTPIIRSAGIKIQ